MGESKGGKEKVHFCARKKCNTSGRKKEVLSENTITRDGLVFQNYWYDQMDRTEIPRVRYSRPHVRGGGGHQDVKLKENAGAKLHGFSKKCETTEKRKWNAQCHGKKDILRAKQTTRARGQRIKLIDIKNKNPQKTSQKLDDSSKQCQWTCQPDTGSYGSPVTRCASEKKRFKANEAFETNRELETGRPGWPKESYVAGLGLKSAMLRRGGHPRKHMVSTKLQNGVTTGKTRENRFDPGRLQKQPFSETDKPIERRKERRTEGLQMFKD